MNGLKFMRVYHTHLPNDSADVINIPSDRLHNGLAEINAPVWPQEVVGHTLNSQMLIG